MEKLLGTIIMADSTLLRKFSLFAEKPDGTQTLWQVDEVEKLLKLAFEKGPDGRAYYERAIDQLRKLNPNSLTFQRWVPRLRLVAWRNHDMSGLNISESDLVKGIDEQTFVQIKASYEKFLLAFQNIFSASNTSVSSG